jgi:hypothetical protein
LRKAVIATLVAVLALATAASAATGGADTGSLGFTSKKAGSSKKPHPVGFTLKIDTTATGSTPPQVTREVKLKVYGMKVDGKHFPTCSLNKIAAAHNDNVCPKGAMIASGAIQATLVGPNGSNPAACDPALHVWNSGPGKQTYLFTTDASHVCLGGALKTGSTPPYAGTYSTHGNTFTSDVKIPNAINYPVTGLTGLLYHEHLKFTSQTKRSKGKKYISQAVTGCKKGKRPWTITVITAAQSAGQSGPGQTTNIPGSSPCSK